MNKTTRNTVIALGLGAAFSFAAPAALAAGNPFAMQTLDHGYTLADAGKDGNGASKKEASEEKTSSTDKAKDGKCGEGKCGGSKPKAKASKPKAKAKAGMSNT